MKNLIVFISRQRDQLAPSTLIARNPWLPATVAAFAGSAVALLMWRTELKRKAKRHS